MHHAPPPPIPLSHFAYPLFLIFPEYLLYQDKLKTMLMYIFGGQIKVCYGRCALANECILRDVQLQANMLIEDIKLWGVEELRQPGNTHLQ